MKSKIISSSLLIVGFLLGASALSAIAGTWTAPASNCTPPNCNVDAPVNVGSSVQTKSGSLNIGSAWNSSWGSQPKIFSTSAYITGLGVENLIVATGSPSAGKVLTAIDDIGTVGWGNAGSGSSEYNFDCALAQVQVNQGFIKLKVCAKINVSTGELFGSTQTVSGAGTGTSHSQPTTFTVSGLNVSGPGKYSILVEEYPNDESDNFKICVINGLGQSSCSIGKVNSQGVQTNSWVSITSPF